MPTYQITDPRTGKKLKVTGDTPPTSAELEQLFSETTRKSAAPEPTLWDTVKKAAYESSPAVLFQRENLPIVGGALAGAATGGAGLIPAVALAGLGGAAGEGVGQMVDAVSERRPVDLPAAGKAMAVEGASQAAQELGGQAVAKGATALARPAYQWALRPYAGLRRNFGLDTLIDTGLNERIAVTPRGTAKSARLRGASSQEARALERAADTAGAPPVTAQDLDSHLTDLRAKLADMKRSGLPDEAAALDARLKAIERENPQGLSVETLGRLKAIEQDLADKSYRAERLGHPVPIASEMHDDIASSMRQEIENRVQGAGLKDIGGVNKRTQGLIGLTRALEDAEGRSAVLGSLLAMSGGVTTALSHGGDIAGALGAGATGAAATKLLTSPAMLSRAAIVLNEAGAKPAVLSSVLRAFGGAAGFQQWYREQLAKQQEPQP